MLLQSICLAQLGLLFGLGLAACGKSDVAANPAVRDGFVRGDRVVVEQSAARFFEGRVLAAASEHLRVQTAGDDDSRNVVTSDAYHLPPEPHDFSVGTLAICGQGEAWIACRVRKVTGTIVSASSATGETFDLGSERILAPSALTELNLKRFFERNQAELGFARDAQRAGEPEPNPSWHPVKRERLLVKLGADWFTAYVRELGDDGVSVELDAGQRSVTVPLSALAPEPPSSVASDLRRGDFVLLRPEVSSEPWARWQIRAVNDDEIRLVDAAGEQRSGSVRDVVLLRP